jgi:hypothetical protein
MQNLKVTKSFGIYSKFVSFSVVPLIITYTTYILYSQFVDSVNFKAGLGRTGYCREAGIIGRYCQHFLPHRRSVSHEKSPCVSA